MIILVVTLVAAVLDIFFVRPRVSALQPKAEALPSYRYLWLNETKTFLDSFALAGVVFSLLWLGLLRLDSDQATVARLLGLERFLHSLKSWTNPLKLSPAEGLGVIALIYALSSLYRPWRKSLPKRYGSYRKVVGKLQGFAGALTMFTLFGSVVGPPQLDLRGRIAMTEHAYGSLEAEVAQRLQSRTADEFLRQTFLRMPAPLREEVRHEAELHRRYRDVRDAIAFGHSPPSDQAPALSKVLEIEAFDEGLPRAIDPSVSPGGERTRDPRLDDLSEAQIAALRARFDDESTWTDRGTLLEELGFRTEVARELTGRLADLPLSRTKEFVLGEVRTRYPALGKLLDIFCSAGTEAIKTRVRRRSARLTRDLLTSPPTDAEVSARFASAASELADPVLPAFGSESVSASLGQATVLDERTAAQARVEVNRYLERTLRARWPRVIGPIEQRGRAHVGSLCNGSDCTARFEAELDRFLQATAELPPDKRTRPSMEALADVDWALGDRSSSTTLIRATSGSGILRADIHTSEVGRRPSVIELRLRVPGTERTVEGEEEGFSSRVPGAVEEPEELPGRVRRPIETPPPRVRSRPPIL